jgi:hypothetical protein
MGNYRAADGDAENRMSDGVGGITGAIPLSPPDRVMAIPSDIF